MFKITNGNDFDFKAKHFGISYAFPKGKTVGCPEDAAAHIFGLGDSNKLTVISRYGWDMPDPSEVRPGQAITGSLKKGEAILAKFKFERIVPKMDVPLASEFEPALEPMEAGEEGTDGSNSPARRGRLS